MTPPRKHEAPRLIALLDAERVGEVFQDPSGRVRFVYDDAWRERPDAYPVSLALPLTAREHGHEPVSAFLWGLLPDNSLTLDRYGRMFGVSSGNPVALLAHIGADCAGAIQFALPERVDLLMSEGNAEPRAEWLTDAEVGAELRTVREQGVPGALPPGVGQFSLAGAQPKLALLEEDGRWGRPSGRTPTNRILKPPSGEFRGFAENEHFCLELAAAIGLAAVRSRVVRFADEIAIVVDRYDRQRVGARYVRIHQEDACQALGVMPTRKYETEGGPGISEIVMLLREASQRPQEDVERFLSAISLTWVLAATDAHAKNYALLHGAGRATRLAPFYDIESYLPYAEPPLHRVRLAMKVGSQYLVRRITGSSWDELAKSIAIPPRKLLDRVEAVVESVEDSVERVRQSSIDEGLDPGAVHPLADRIRGRAVECLAELHRHARTP